MGLKPLRTCSNRELIQRNRWAVVLSAFLGVMLIVGLALAVLKPTGPLLTPLVSVWPILIGGGSCVFPVFGYAVRIRREINRRITRTVVIAALNMIHAESTLPLSEFD